MTVIPVRTPRRDRRVSRRRGAVFGVVALLVASCTSSPDQRTSEPADRGAWLEETRESLERVFLADRRTAVYVETSSDSPRVYEKAIAIVGLGEQAATFVNADSFTISRAQFGHDLRPTEIGGVLPPTVPLVTEVVRADAMVGGTLVTEEQWRHFRLIVDNVLEDHQDIQESWLSYDVMSIVEISRAADHRVDDVAAWALSMEGQLQTPLACERIDDLIQLGPAVAVGIPIPCADETLRTLWERAVSSLLDTLPGAKPAPSDECSLVLPLAQVFQGLWPDDVAAASSLVDVFEAAEGALAGRNLQSQPFCARELRLTADRIGATLALSDATIAYLKAFLVGIGGTPRHSVLQLPAVGPASLLRLARLVGAEGAVARDIEWLAEHRIDSTAWRVEAAGPRENWPGDLITVVNELVPLVEGDPVIRGVFMRALAYAGRDACSPESVDVAHRFLIGAAEQNVRDATLETQAHALLALRACGAAMPEAEERVTAEAETVIAMASTGDRPVAEVTADAVGAVCALESDALPKGGRLWSLYAEEVISVAGDALTGEAPGGAATPLSHIYALAVLAIDPAPSCKTSGVVG